MIKIVYNNNIVNDYAFDIIEFLYAYLKDTINAVKATYQKVLFCFIIFRCSSHENGGSIQGNSITTDEHCKCGFFF